MLDDYKGENNYKDIEQEIEKTNLNTQYFVDTSQVKIRYHDKKFFKGMVAAFLFGIMAGIIFLGVNDIRSNHNMADMQSETENIAESGDTVTKNLDTNDTAGNVAEVVSNVIPSIVSITCQSIVTTSDIFGRTFRKEATASGSGIIIAANDTSVLIATNNHVVEGAKNVKITFFDESIVEATVKGTDVTSDLAVVAVDLIQLSDETKSRIKIATLGNSNSLKAGEQAIAIGNALGYGQSVTVGYISALNREIELGNGIMTLLQTDAAINPGNSGGALLNAKGEVIGINSVKYSNQVVEGIGYAIPISDAIPIMNQLMNKVNIPESKKAVLGIKGQDISKETSKSFHMPVGVYIREVIRGSKAEKAGLKMGDIIVSLNDRTISSMKTLQEALSYFKVGDTTKITIRRQDNGTYYNLTIDITF